MFTKGVTSSTIIGKLVENSWRVLESSSTRGYADEKSHIAGRSTPKTHRLTGHLKSSTEDREQVVSSETDTDLARHA